MITRLASFCCVAAFVFAVGSGSAHAQGGPPPVAGGGAIQALFDQIAALEARVTALETTDLSDIVGTYRWESLGIEMNSLFRGTPPIPARIGTSTASVTFTLHADGTVTFAGTDFDCTMTQGVWTVSCRQPNDESGTLTWSYANGVVTIDTPDEQLNFLVTPSGTMIYSQTSPFLPGHSWSTIGILVKVS